MTISHILNNPSTQHFDETDRNLSAINAAKKNNCVLPECVFVVYFVRTF